MRKIEVVKGRGGVGMGRTKYFLRLYLSSERIGTICFETREEFSKAEADCRAMFLAVVHGLKHDELPTHEAVEPYPKDGDDEDI